MTDEIDRTLDDVRGAPARTPSTGQSKLHPYLTRGLRALALCSLLVAVYAHGPAFIANVAQLRTANQIATNAAVKQHGLAAAQHAEAAKQLEDARNAADRLKAEAAKTEHEADALEQDAVTKHNEALNAKNKAKAVADATVAQAERVRQEGATALAEAQVAALQMKVEADQAEQTLQSARRGLRNDVYVGGMIHCPGTTYIAKINYAYEHNGSKNCP